jgi:hypothetical protein
MDTRSTFSILDHIEIEPAKERAVTSAQPASQTTLPSGKQRLPVLEWLQNKDIREALAPRGEKHQELRNSRVIPCKPKPKALTPAALPALDQLVLGTLPESPTDIPRKQHRLDRERGKVTSLYMGIRQPRR